MSKLPTIVKNILIEAFYDFENVDIGDDISKTNLKNLLTDIKNGKDEINILESSVLFEFFYGGYSEFKKFLELNKERLENDTLNYYEYLHKIYYDDIDFKSLNPNTPKTLMIIVNKQIKSYN